MRSLYRVCVMALFLSVSACSGPTQVAIPNLPQAMPVDPPGGSYMLTANTFAGDALQKMLLLRMGSGGGILTTSFVAMDDFERTSAFGRVASQQVGSRLGQYGFRVIEARLASTLSMAPRAGEFMLTREAARLLADTYDANAVMVGSYSDDGSNVFVSVRVVRLSDNVVMGAYEYYLPRSGEVGRLLAGSGGDSVWERYSRRTPAFGPCEQSVSSPSKPVGRTIPAKTAKAVPRYVDPNAKAAAPVKKNAPEPPVAKAPPAPAAPSGPPAVPIPLEKDAPAPAHVPGGA